MERNLSLKNKFSLTLTDFSNLTEIKPSKIKCSVLLVKDTGKMLMLARHELDLLHAMQG